MSQPVKRLLISKLQQSRHWSQIDAACGDVNTVRGESRLVMAVAAQIDPFHTIVRRVFRHIQHVNDAGRVIPQRRIVRRKPLMQDRPGSQTQMNGGRSVTGVQDRRQTFVVVALLKANSLQKFSGPFERPDASELLHPVAWRLI